MKEIDQIKKNNKRINQIDESFDRNYFLSQLNYFNLSLFFSMQVFALAMILYCFFSKASNMYPFLFILACIGVIFSSLNIIGNMALYNKFVNKHQCAIFYISSSTFAIISIFVFSLNKIDFITHLSYSIFFLIGIIFTIQNVFFHNQWKFELKELNLEKEKIKENTELIIKNLINDDEKILILSKLSDPNVNKVKLKILKAYEESFKKDITFEKILEEKKNTIINY